MTIPSRITTLVWDLDGTIIDSMAVMQEVLAAILPAYGREAPTREVIAQHIHGSMEDIINNSLGGIDRDELDTIYHNYMLAQHQHYELVGHHVYPDALELMQQAHESGKHQIIVTNRNHKGMELGSPHAIVASSGLGGYVSDIFCGDDCERRKPEPEVLGSYLADHGIMPSQLLVIGDQFVDAQFSSNLGCRSVLVTHYDKRIPHLDQLTPAARRSMTVVPTLGVVKVPLPIQVVPACQPVL
jgi:phosphoglycolate phosphatase